MSRISDAIILVIGEIILIIGAVFFVIWCMVGAYSYHQKELQIVQMFSGIHTTMELQTKVIEALAQKIKRLEEGEANDT